MKPKFNLKEALLMCGLSLTTGMAGGAIINLMYWI